MKRLFLDSEFNGFVGILISMALVGDDDKEFYEVKEKPSELDTWVAENVIPVLGKETAGPALFKLRFRRFLSGFPDGVEIIADWPSDFEHLFRELMGSDHEDTLAIPIVARMMPNLVYSSKQPHNALEDARALRLAYMSSINP